MSMDTKFTFKEGLWNYIKIIGFMWLASFIACAITGAL